MVTKALRACMNEALEYAILTTRKEIVFDLIDLSRDTEIALTFSEDSMKKLIRNGMNDVIEDLVNTRSLLNCTYESQNQMVKLQELINFIKNDYQYCKGM